MSLQDVFRLCQQEQSIDNHIERVVVVVLRCINPSIQRWLQICEFSDAETKRHWSMEMWKKVIWSDESSFTIFSTSGREPVWPTPRTVQAWMLDTYSYGSRWLFYMWGAWLGSTCPLRGKSHCKSIQSCVTDAFYPMMKHFYPDGRGPCPHP